MGKVKGHDDYIFDNSNLFDINRLIRLAADMGKLTKGQVLVEYVLIIGVIGLVIGAAVALLADSLTEFFTSLVAFIDSWTLSLELATAQLEALQTAMAPTPTVTP